MATSRFFTISFTKSSFCFALASRSCSGCAAVDGGAEATPIGTSSLLAITHAMRSERSAVEEHHN